MSYISNCGSEFSLPQGTLGFRIGDMIRKAVHFSGVILPVSMLGICSLSVAEQVSVDEQDVDISTLQTVVVTGVREEDRSQIAKNITVITRSDIEQSSANQLTELLSREANVNLRSVTGSDKYSSVDMRGMGDTHVSNVLVLVDGVRLNRDDLSGPDFSSIPLSQIERIEIIRSGGGVRYGNGAVGGVINIVTKSRQTDMSAYVARGSFGTEEVRLNLASAEHDKLSVKTNISYHNSDGYRNNGDLQKKDLLLDLEYQFTDSLKQGVMVKFHRDTFGLPGPVTKQKFDAGSPWRKATTAPEDGGESQEDFARWRLNYEDDGKNRFDMSLYYRDRMSHTLLQYSPAFLKEDQMLSIEDRRYGGDLVYTRTDDFFSGSSRFSIGSEFFVTDYEQYRNGRSVVDQSQRKIGSLDGIAFFSDWGIELGRFNFSTGWRTDSVKLDQQETNLKRLCDYDYVIIPPFPFPIPVEKNCREEWVNTADRNDDWKNSAFESGVVYQFNDSLNAFLGYSKSFRNPNLDELLLSDGDLVPQSGKHWDIGLRFDNGIFKWDVTAFSIDTEDEILYGVEPATGLAVNRNSDDPTRRYGVEVDTSYRFYDDRLIVKGSIGYIEAKFKESDAFVPLVPKVNSSLSLIWKINPSLTSVVTANYAGRRFDGNDFSNSLYDELGSYYTVDMKFTWHMKNAEFFLSAQNILNEVYSTSAYSGTFYPMPERNFMTGFRVFY